jgi:hypothetical protein
MGVKFNPFTGNLDLIDTTAAAGLDGQVQFNSSGLLDGSADFTWDDTGKVLDVGGDINLDDGGSFQTTLQLVTPTAARTITFPDATGTVGLVAGSTGQLVFNNAGAYSGLSGVTTDGTDITLTGRFISSLNGAASAPPGTFTGTWFTGGTATTTKPQVLIEPTGTTSTAWSTSGTGLGVNAASGFGGRLLDLQLNGTSNFNVDSTGRTSFPLGTAALPALYPGTDTNTGMWSPAADTLAWSTNGVERTRIDSSGRLLVGTSTGLETVNDTGVSTQTFLNIAAAGGAPAGAVFRTARANNIVYSNIILDKQRGNLGAPAAVISGDYLGAITFTGYDGAAQIACAAIAVQADGTPGANDMPGRLVFSTTAAGASSPTERLRITNNGVLQVADAGNISVGTTTGTKIGTATTQKLGFYNATPVVQPAAVTDITTTATAGTLPTPDGTVTIADADVPTVDELLEYCVELEAKLEAALGHLRTLGLIAT